jgi:hypothetical protein
MRLILDECIDRRLTRDFVGHDIKTVSQMGWAGIKNGQLLTLVEPTFRTLKCHTQVLTLQAFEFKGSNA